MEAVEYEEGYFKLKKSNEELVTLLNKVINDLKLTKISHKTEKEKNTTLSAANGNLSLKIEELTRQCEEQNKTIADLNDELNYLKSYSKAVEGVAENYCGQNISTQKKYDKLKRQSNYFLSNLPDTSTINIDFNDYESETFGTPDPIYQIEEIKKNHVEIMDKEKQKFEDLRTQMNETKDEIIKYKSEIEDLNQKLEEKHHDNDKLKTDMDILITSYKTLKEDHEKMMIYFAPYLKIKSEYNELKRTSAVLLNNVANDEKIMELLRMIEDLKSEIDEKSSKILTMELQIIELQQSSVLLELAAVKTELDDLTVKLKALTKERDNLKHENRILEEQKGGYGILPPLPPPPPPPPPQSSSILKIFKKKKNQQVVSSKTSAIKSEDVLICNLMNELEQKLLLKVKNSMKKPENSPVTPDQSSENKHNFAAANFQNISVPNVRIDNEKKHELKERKKTCDSPISKNSFDQTDFNSEPSYSVNLRKFSMPNIKPCYSEPQNNELNTVLKKFGVQRISEKE